MSKILISELPKICYTIEQLIQINKVIVKRNFITDLPTQGYFQQRPRILT